MRLLAIYRHYWPDITPYARLLRAIAEDLVAHGHAATVYTAQPSYNDVRMPHQPRREDIGGVAVRRARLPRESKSQTLVRLINAISFLVQATVHAVRHRREYDLLLFNVHPPILMGLTARIIKRLTGIPYVAHVQDIHPDAARLAGRFRNDRMFAFLKRIDARNGQRAAKNVVLSDDMRATLAARRIDEARIEVLNNFSLDRYYEPETELPAPLNENDHYTVLFAGNLGDFQQLDLLVDAALEMRSETTIHFVLMGSGAARARLIERAAPICGKTLFFVDQQPVEVAFAAMKRSDLGVVSLLPGVYRVAYPSKTMMYLAAGCALLALIEADSVLATQIDRHRLGHLAPQHDPRAVAEVIRAAAAAGSRPASERERLIAAGDELFCRDRALARWRRLLVEAARP